MTNVVVVVEGGVVRRILTRNRSIQIEVIDLDTGDDDKEYRKNEKRLNAIENSKTYKDIY